MTSLLGSLGLHCCIVVGLLLVARKPSALAHLPQDRPDSWLGNAVEVDAVAAPETTPNIANEAIASPPAEPNAPALATQAAALPEPTPQKPSTKALEATARPPAAPPATSKRQAARTRVSANPSPTQAVGDGSHEATTAAATGAFGSEGLPPGVRSLPSAFTRAIPPATGADPIWQSLPLGRQRPFTLSIEIDAQGHIGNAQILGARDGSDVPVQFEHFRQRVIALLGGGLFALKNNATAGRDLFRITITLSERGVPDESASADLVERGFDPPRGSSAGRAYFTLASGRHFEAQVEVLGAAAGSRP